MSVNNNILTFIITYYYIILFILKDIFAGFCKYIDIFNNNFSITTHGPMDQTNKILSLMSFKGFGRLI